VPFYAYWGILVWMFWVASCTRRGENVPVSADVTLAADASAAGSDPDCESIARGYVPCLPFPDTAAPELLQPPETPFALPCGKNGLRVDLFTDLQSPRDIRILQEILREENVHPGICLFLHPAGDLMPGARLFAELAANPANGWRLLRSHVEEKRYLTWMEEYGPPAPAEQALQERLDAFVRRARDFGVRETPLVLVDGRVRTLEADGKLVWAAPSAGGHSASGSAVSHIIWLKKNPRLEELTREFAILCKTRQNWRPRMAVIQECLARKECGAVRDCISDRLYEKEWEEMEVSEPTESWKPMAVMGQGTVAIHAWLDPDCPHSRETFFHLRDLVQDGSVKVEIELVASHPKGGRVREILLNSRVGRTGAAACFLDLAFSYYDLLDEADWDRLLRVCGMPGVTLQNGEKSGNLPVGELPAFCSSRITPCLYLAQHVMEGSMSLNFLKFAISRAAGRRKTEMR